MLHRISSCRFFSFGESNVPHQDAACSLQISEDSRAHGHGTSHTWGTAWDSGIVLGACVARFLKATTRGHPDERPWSDFRAVELGCGGGVAGLALAASLGMKTVLTGEEMNNKANRTTLCLHEFMMGALI